VRAWLGPLFMAAKCTKVDQSKICSPRTGSFHARLSDSSFAETIRAAKVRYLFKTQYERKKNKNKKIINFWINIASFMNVNRIDLK
jgi:hypothetical protein